MSKHHEISVWAVLYRGNVKPWSFRTRKEAINYVEGRWGDYLANKLRRHKMIRFVKAKLGLVRGKA